MAKLFAYGTLMCPEIFEKVCGMTPRAVVPSRVRNYRCLCVRGEAYPGLVKGQGGVVEGLIYTFPSYLWSRLDAFEGAQYMRKPVTACYDNGKRELVQTYHFRPEFRHQLSRSTWNFEGFLTEGREAFIATYTGWQAAQRD